MSFPNQNEVMKPFIKFWFMTLNFDEMNQSGQDSCHQSKTCGSYRNWRSHRWGWYFATQQQIGKKQQILSNNHPVFLMMFEIPRRGLQIGKLIQFLTIAENWILETWSVFFENMVENTHNFPSTSTIQVVIKLGEPKIYCSPWGCQSIQSMTIGGFIFLLFSPLLGEDSHFD